MKRTGLVIVGAVRTPIGNFGGSLKDIAPSDLAARVVKEAVARAKIDPAVLIEEMDHVFVDIHPCVTNIASGRYPRQTQGSQPACYIEDRFHRLDGSKGLLKEGFDKRQPLFGGSMQGQAGTNEVDCFRSPDIFWKFC